MPGARDRQRPDPDWRDQGGWLPLWRGEEIHDLYDKYFASIIYNIYNIYNIYSLCNIYYLQVLCDPGYHLVGFSKTLKCREGIWSQRVMPMCGQYLSYLQTCIIYNIYSYYYSLYKGFQYYLQ